MSKYINIDGEYFEVIKPRKHEVTPVYPTQWDYTDIMQAYVKPSVYKQSIWDYWRSFMGDEAHRFGNPFITSRNCFSFTVTFNVYDENFDFIGVARITKDYNRLYLAR